MINIKKFCQQLKSHRLALGCTQAELSEKLNISVKFLSELENGNNIPSTTTTLSILNFFNLDMNDFLDNKSSERDFETNSILSKLRSIQLNESDKKYLLEIASIISNRKMT